DGNGGQDYSVTLQGATGSISAAALTISAVGDSKGYDGTTTSAQTPTVTGALYGSDTVSNLAQSFDSRHAGARTLAVTSYTVNDGNGGQDYSVTLQGATGSISATSHER